MPFSRPQATASLILTGYSQPEPHLSCTIAEGVGTLGTTFHGWSRVMPVFPSGTVAFLFTDIEGSTKRRERDTAAMWAAV